MVRRHQICFGWPAARSSARNGPRSGRKSADRQIKVRYSNGCGKVVLTAKRIGIKIDPAGIPAPVKAASRRIWLIGVGNWLSTGETQTSAKGSALRAAANSGTPRPVGSKLYQPGQPRTAPALPAPPPKLISRHRKTPSCGMLCHPTGPRPARMSAVWKILVEGRVRLRARRRHCASRQSRRCRCGVNAADRCPRPLELRDTSVARMRQARSPDRSRAGYGPVGGRIRRPWRPNR